MKVEKTDYKYLQINVKNEYIKGTVGQDVYRKE